MKYAVIAGALSLFSITAVANETAGLSYDYVKLSKQVSSNWYLTGLYASTSDDLSNSVSEDYRDIFQNGEYVGTSQLYTEGKLDAEFTRLELSAGYIQRLSAVTNLDYSINLGRLKYSTDFINLVEERFNGQVFSSSESAYSDSDSADILSANVQVRHLVTDKFEVNAGLGYERLHDEESDNNVVLKAGFNYTLTEKAILGASYRYVDEYADIAATLRYYF